MIILIILAATTSRTRVKTAFVTITISITCLSKIVALRLFIWCRGRRWSVVTPFVILSSMTLSTTIAGVISTLQTIIINIARRAQIVALISVSLDSDATKKLCCFRRIGIGVGGYTKKDGQEE